MNRSWRAPSGSKTKLVRAWAGRFQHRAHARVPGGAIRLDRFRPRLDRARPRAPRQVRVEERVTFQERARHERWNPRAVGRNLLWDVTQAAQVTEYIHSIEDKPRR